MGFVRFLILLNGSQRPNKTHCFALISPAHMKHKVQEMWISQLTLLAKEVILFMMALCSMKASTQSGENLHCNHLFTTFPFINFTNNRELLTPSGHFCCISAWPMWSSSMLPVHVPVRHRAQVLAWVSKSKWLHSHASAAWHPVGWISYCVYARRAGFAPVTFPLPSTQLAGVLPVNSERPSWHRSLYLIFSSPMYMLFTNSFLL